MPLQKRTFLVTGGAKGLGRAMSSHLSRRGARVLILDSDLAHGKEQLKRLGKGAGFLHCDLARPDEVRAAAGELRRFPRLDGMVNNAGVNCFRPLEQLSLEDWDRVMNINLRGAFYCLQQVLPRLKPGGAVVNIASTRALMSEPNSEAYAASKGGLLSLTHALAMSLQKRRIRVNAIAAGWVDASNLRGRGRRERIRPDQHSYFPVGRVGRPQDVVEAADFLLDPRRSGFMTGQRLVLDGGLSVKMSFPW